MQNPPANLEFKPELYKEPVRTNTGAVPVTKTSQETTAVKKPAVAAEPTPKPSSTVNQTEQKERLATQRSGVQPVSLEGSHEQAKGKQWDERGDPDKYIDLLKTKWILPVAAVSILRLWGVLCCGCIWEADFLLRNLWWRFCSLSGKFEFISGVSEEMTSKAQRRK